MTSDTVHQNPAKKRLCPQVQSRCGVNDPREVAAPEHSNRQGLRKCLKRKQRNSVKKLLIFNPKIVLKLINEYNSWWEKPTFIEKRINI